jgi:hypothetical protein
MEPTIVFLGPSLDRPTARHIFPGARFLPPAQCGDVLQVLRMSPRAIVLIDGLFEQRPSVWHKEIAFALERGVPVLGASSMGALRAAEMAPLGMLGVGRVFEQFRDCVLVDDDEVAVVQRPTGEALTDAMVNVRATVASAREKDIISSSAADRLLEQVKGVFYAERNLTELLASSVDPAVHPLRCWVGEHGMVDIKRQDAVAALVMARNLDETGWPEPPRISTPRTTFFNRALRMANCSPLQSSCEGLPYRERVLLAARYLGNVYTQVKELALLRAALSDVAMARGLASVDALESALLDATRPNEPTARVRWLVRAELPRYESYVRAHHRELGSSARAVPLLARAWRLVDLAFQAARMDAEPEALKRWAVAYRRRYGLLSRESLAAFLGGYGFDARAWVEMVRIAVLTHRAGHDLHLTGFGAGKTDERSQWLEEALQETGYYGNAEEILRDSSCAVLPRTALEAIERDFGFGEDRATSELARLTS